MESFYRIIMDISIIPDDMMFLSKLEYQALIDENEFLRASLRNKDNYISEQRKTSLDNISAQILKLPKHDEQYTYFIQISCGDMPRSIVVDFLKALRSLLEEAGVSLKNIILVPMRGETGQIQISKICSSCPLKPDKFSWDEVIKHTITEVSQTGVLALPEISAKEKDIYQQLITVKFGGSFNNRKISQKIRNKRNEH